MYHNTSKNKLKIFQAKIRNIYILLSLIIFVISIINTSTINAVYVLLGIVSVLIPNLVLIKKAFSSSGANNSKKILGNFFIGEAIKIVFSIILLTIFFILCYNNANLILTGFIIGILIVGIAPILVKLKR